MDVRAAEEAEIDHLAKVWYDGWQDAHAEIVPAELARLRAFWIGQQERFGTDEAATCAAYARVLLNLDETITRE